MLHKRVFVFALALLVFTLGFAAIAFAQEETPEATETPLPNPEFTVEPESTLDPSRVFITPLLDNAVVNIRRGPGLTFGVRGVLRPSRYLEAVGYNGFDLDRPCSEVLRNDLDMWIQVRFNQGEAWVARCVVTVEGDLSLLPAVVPESTAEATGEAPVPQPTTEPPAATQES
jgi:hypothetical protein